MKNTDKTKVAEPTVEIIDIDPDTAKMLLEENTHNRPINWNQVRALAGAMTRGEFHFNADAIRRSSDNVVLDGQHRLLAVVESGVTIRQVFADDLPPEAQETIDIGVKRTVGNMLELKGVKYGTNLAAVARYVLNHRRRENGEPTSIKLTPQQIIQFVNAHHDDLVEAILWGQRLYRTTHLPLSISAGLFHEFATKDTEQAVAFYELAMDPVRLPNGHPALALRNILLRAFSRTNEGYSHDALSAFVIKSWNAYREGRDMKVLTWRPGGGEPFPAIQ